MYTLCHSYIFRNCFNFFHSTTLRHGKRVLKHPINMTSNSGFVRSADFLPYETRQLFCHCWCHDDNVQDNIYIWCNNLDIIASNRPSVELWLKWTMAHMAQVTDNNGGAKTKRSTLIWSFWSVWSEWSLWWSTYIRKGREAWVDKGGVLRQTQGYILPLLLTIMQTIDNHYSK